MDRKETVNKFCPGLNPEHMQVKLFFINLFYNRREEKIL